MRTIVMMVVLLAACGGGAKGATLSTGPAENEAAAGPTALELAEITISEGGLSVLIHADGDVEVSDGKDRKVIGSLAADGTFTLPDGDVGQLQADGSFTTRAGPAPFKLDGETLVAGNQRITIDEANVIRGATVDMSATKITGVTSRGTRRTALLVIGFMLLGK